MEEKSKEYYELLFEVALYYRLSLNNLCKIMGKEVNEQNKSEIYDKFNILFGYDIDKKNAYQFLFSRETVNESEESAKKALTLSKLYLNRYMQAISNDDKKSVKIMQSELKKLDKQFKNLSIKENEPLSKEDADIITRYRLKYAISREAICQRLNLSYKALQIKEYAIEDEGLKNKLNMLADFYSDLYHKRYK